VDSGQHTTYNCTTGVGETRHISWSPQKIRWCCQRHPALCKQVYNCKSNLQDWENAWSPLQQWWCCEHSSVGCPVMSQNSTTRGSVATAGASSTPAADQHYECETGPSSNAEDWPEPKKRWCCVHYSIGCPINCTVGFYTYQTTWTYRKLKWCCLHEPHWCPTTEAAINAAKAGTTKAAAISSSLASSGGGISRTSSSTVAKSARSTMMAPLFDCHADASNWERSWSRTKKQWCCEHEKLHCADNPQHANFDMFHYRDAIHGKYTLGHSLRERQPRQHRLAADACGVFLAIPALAALVSLTVITGRCFRIAGLRQHQVGTRPLLLRSAE